MGWSDRKVVIGEDGFGEFVCAECSVSVFVNEAAEGRDQFGKRYYLTFTQTNLIVRTCSRSISIRITSSRLYHPIFVELRYRKWYLYLIK